MTVSRSGDLWRGDNDEDLAVYVRSFRAGGRDVAETRPLTCPACSGAAFGVLVDDDESEGAAVAGCLSCGAQVPIGDSASRLADASLAECTCPCGADTFTAVIGHAARTRHLTVGLRCQTCGVLGVYADFDA